MFGTCHQHIHAPAPQGTAHGKRVQANQGAKNHAVILPDADKEVIAESSLWAGGEGLCERVGRRMDIWSRGSTVKMDGWMDG